MRIREKEMPWWWGLLLGCADNKFDANEEEAEQYRKTRIAQLEDDPEEWFAYYFPDFAYARAAEFHRASTRRMLEHAEWYEVRLWSRELAKSARTMMEVFYLTLVGHKIDNQEGDTVKTGWVERLKKRCVLLISNSLNNAVRLLAPYKTNLEYNDRIVKDYGIQRNAGRWTDQEFVTKNGVAFRALGAGQSPRGTRNEAVRPDIIIFDDVDTDADCLNPMIIAKKWRWVEEAAIGTRSISEATTIIFCGNRIAKDCTIERARYHADHEEVINIRDEKGHSVWPEKNKEADIDRVLSQKSYAAQQKEYFNNPLTEGSVFKELAYKPARQISEYEMLVCYTDPSYKTTNDYKATVLVGMADNEFHVIKCFLEQATTAQMIDWIYRIMDLVGDRSCYYYMEEVFMQDVIRKEVSDAGKKRGRIIPISGDRRKKPDKYMRIETLLDPLNRNGELYFNKSEEDNPHMRRLAEQFAAFGPGSQAHDDGPDAIEGAIWIMTEKKSKGIGEGIVATRRRENSKRY